MNKIDLKVVGMVCNGCETRVTKALKNIKGVKKVKASFKKELVQVTCEDNIEDLIIKTIEDLGYEVKKEA